MVPLLYLIVIHLGCLIHPLQLELQNMILVLELIDRGLLLLLL